jgi:hypothetical protein
MTSEHGWTSERGTSEKYPCTALLLKTARRRAGISSKSGADFYERVFGAKPVSKFTVLKMSEVIPLNYLSDAVR